MLIKKRANSNLNVDQSNLQTSSCKQNSEAYFRIICAKYYSDKFANKFANCLLLIEGTCHNVEFEPAEKQNAKTSTAFLKRGESI